jgi:hypothetical protein
VIVILVGSRTDCRPCRIARHLPSDKDRTMSADDERRGRRTISRHYLATHCTAICLSLVEMAITSRIKRSALQANPRMGHAFVAL